MKIYKKKTSPEELGDISNAKQPVNELTNEERAYAFLDASHHVPKDKEEVISDLIFADGLATGYAAEDTVKQGNYWVNKGKQGTHGKFRTKKEADAQRKAMFANGYAAEDLDYFVEDSLTDEEKSLCDYMLDNAREPFDTPDDLLRKMEVYYSPYQSLVRSKPDAVYSYFQEHFVPASAEEAEGELDIDDAGEEEYLVLVKQSPDEGFLEYRFRDNYQAYGTFGGASEQGQPAALLLKEENGWKILALSPAVTDLEDELEEQISLLID